MSLLIRRKELDFLLYEWLHIESILDKPLFAEHSREIFDSILDTAQKIAEEKFAPHAAEVDEQEPTFDGEKVHILPAVKEALDAYIEAGFLGIHFGEESGGMQLPYTLSQACASLFYAANVSTAAYPLLTVGAARLIESFGNEEQKARYMQPMIEGRFFGTMCLSEPQAGSSLGDIRTKAEPQDDGSYLISGNKMWISGGEHDLSENIIHLVLAKIPGGPAGVKGISLFIVPKLHVNEDLSLGEQNDVSLAGLNHKMGYRGTINTALNFGENGQCKGFLVGEAHRGLFYMFQMMNEARIAVGLGASVLGYTGFLHSLDYARNRPQGRSPEDRDPTSSPVPIIQHADVRRMLLAQKAYSEGALALGFYCAKLVDTIHTSTESEEKKELSLLLDLLTPIAKAWPSEYCLKANDLAIQVLGGYGYTRDYPVERFYRDNRLNPIHEGANGIQAIDLLGRKAMMKQGAAFRLLLQKVHGTIANTRQWATEQNNEAIQEYAEALEKAVETVTSTTLALSQVALQGKSKLFLANASVYLDMLGHTVIAWIWLEQAWAAAQKQHGGSESEGNFYEGKLQACKYFYRWELPKIKQQAQLLESLDDTCLNMPESAF